MKATRHRSLLSQLRLPHDRVRELKQALTHQSFYKGSDKQGNSRDVYLGMFFFRGILAEHLHRYIPTTGQKLQHLLGNLMKNHRLEALYDKLNLDDLVRHGEDFDRDRHKHIYVYGLLGFIAQYGNSESTTAFINTHILDDALIAKTLDHKMDVLQQMQVLAWQHYGVKAKIETSREEDLRHTVCVTLPTIHVSHTSKSPTYARKKAIKKMMTSILAEQEARLAQDDTYRQLVEMKKERKEELRREENRLKHEEVLRYQKEQKEKRLLRKEALRIEKEKRDKARRRSKARAKERRKIEELEAKKPTKPMNAGKRRYLEDKLK